MKRHLKVLTAIAVATLAILVVVINLGPAADEPDSAEALQNFQRRQSERFEASRLARRQGQARGGILSADQLKERLLQEFPNLRGDPPIPNENNSVHLLIKLGADLLGEDGKFRDELTSVMGPNAEWDLKAAQALIERYDWVFDRITEIAVQERGSWHQGIDIDFEGKGQWHPDAPLLLMDLLRLKMRVASEKGEGVAITDAHVNLVMFSNAITFSEGASFADRLMMQANLNAAPDAPMNEDLYAEFSGLGLYGAALRGALQSDWSASLNKESLDREIRRVWWDEVYLDPTSAFFRAVPSSSPIFAKEPVPIEHPEAAQAYARYVSNTLERLGTTELREFILEEPPALDVSELPEHEQSIALTAVERFNQQLAAIHFDATLQSMQKAAIKIRQMEKAGVRVSSKTTRHLAPDPVTGEAYTYDPETRILLTPNPVMGMKGIRIKQAQEGRLLDVVDELITTDEE